MNSLVDRKKLTGFEHVVLSHLELNVGAPVKYQILEDALALLRPYGSTVAPATNVLQVLVGRIRKKLPPGASISAVPKIGYQLTVVGKCDSCDTQPGTRTILVAAGTETNVCDNCTTQESSL